MKASSTWTVPNTAARGMLKGASSQILLRNPFDTAPEG